MNGGIKGLPMFRKLLLFPVALWLLLPPGICVCRGFGNLLPVLGSEAAPSDDAPICEDSEHAPWCPVHKMTYLNDATAPPVPDLGALWADTLPVPHPSLSAGYGDASLPAPAAQPADSALYLNLCALRI